MDKSNEFDTIILVTHLEYCEYLPAMFQTKIMEIKESMFGIGKGEVYELDFQTKTCAML